MFNAADLVLFAGPHSAVQFAQLDVTTGSSPPRAPPGMAHYKHWPVASALRAGSDRQRHKNRVPVSGRSCGPAIDPEQSVTLSPSFASETGRSTRFPEPVSCTSGGLASAARASSSERSARQLHQAVASRPSGPTSANLRSRFMEVRRRRAGLCVLVVAFVVTGIGAGPCETSAV